MYFSRMLFWLFLQSKGIKRSLITENEMKMMVIDALTEGTVANMSEKAVRLEFEIQLNF